MGLDTATLRPQEIVRRAAQPARAHRSKAEGHRHRYLGQVALGRSESGGERSESPQEWQAFLPRSPGQSPLYRVAVQRIARGRDSAAPGWVDQGKLEDRPTIAPSRRL